MTKEAVVLEHRSATAGLVDRLLEIQKRSQTNHISESAISELAQDLKVSVGFVRGVASFYSMLSEKPRGRHIIRVCQSPHCKINAQKSIAEWLTKQLGIHLGETTPDGDFTIEASSCLGGCSKPPVMQVDDTLYTSVNADNLGNILDQVRKNNSSGPRQELTTILGKRHLLKSCESAELENAETAGVYQGLKKAISRMTPKQVIQEIKDSGLRGRGGAGFPTGRKWEFTQSASGEPKYIVCNADEGEPGTFKDRLLLEGCPHLVIEGMVIAGYAVGASKGFIYIRGEYAQSIGKIKKALAQARAANYLGNNILGSDFSFDIEVYSGAGAYVCGEETSLIESMEGKRGFPRLRPPYPATVGLFGKPTVINNVETLANVGLIVRDGSAAYRSLGNNSASGTKLYPLSGALVNTGVAEAPIGITLRELIYDLGGGMADGKQFLAALVGGAAGVFLGEDKLDVPLDYDSLCSHGAVLGSGAVLVLDRECDPGSLVLDILRFFKHESCGQCAPCRIGTTRLVEMMENLMQTKDNSDDTLGLMLETAQVMQKTSLCPLGQSAYPMLRSAVHYFGDYLGTHQEEDI